MTMPRKSETVKLTDVEDGCGYGNQIDWVCSSEVERSAYIGNVRGSNLRIPMWTRSSTEERRSSKPKVLWVRISSCPLGVKTVPSDTVALEGQKDGQVT